MSAKLRNDNALIDATLLIEEGAKTQNIRNWLVKFSKGIKEAQANDIIRVARKRLGIYKKRR